MRISVASRRDQEDDNERHNSGQDRPDLQQAEETRIGFVRRLHFLLSHRFSPSPVPVTTPSAPPGIARIGRRAGLSHAHDDAQ